MNSHAQADVSKAAFTRVKAATGVQNRNDGYARILTGTMTGSKLDKMPDETWEEFEARVEAVL